MKQGLRLFYLCALFTCAALFAQESLWRDQNPYVAPAREISILVAALYGTHLLREGHVARRLAAAAMMMLGLAGIALG